MSSEPYLTRLTVKLIDGLEGVPAEVKDRHVAYIRGKQRPDGGFPGREGGSDLYYTGFALRSLAVTQSLTPEVGDAAAGFLRERMRQPAGVVDFFSLLVSCYLVPLGGGPDLLADAPADWKDRVVATLNSFRTSDGGYGKSPGAASGSTYTSFLVALCLQLLERPIPEPERLVAFVNSRKRNDGGYVEIAPMRRSGTNPTAAGVGLLQIADALSSEARESVATFLSGLPSPFEGGFRANDRIPAADLLSTFTGTWTLAELRELDRVDRTAIRDFAESIELPTGGFRGGMWDDGDDVEYTFYGLGTLAITQEP
jgi:geranylgeranyl transferase type-2 subunit beta